MDLGELRDKLDFTPHTILDIGANTGWWYGKAKEAWPDVFIWMIEGNPHCESELKKINDNYTIALLSDEVKEVDFYTLKNDLTATGASYYKENTDVPIKNIVSSSFTKHSASYQQKTFISKIGIYDDAGDLVAMAKLANPVRKTNEQDYTFKLKLDL